MVSWHNDSHILYAYKDNRSFHPSMYISLRFSFVPTILSYQTWMWLSPKVWWCGSWNWILPDCLKSFLYTIDINIDIYLIIFTWNCVAVVSSLRKNGQSKCRDVSWGLQPLSMLANVLVAASILLLLLRSILFGSSWDRNAREGRWQARCMCISLLISCVWYNCKKFLLLFVHKHCLLLISKECPVFTDTYNIA